MCTAVNLTSGHHFFGRNLDLDRSYDEKLCILPRNAPLDFRRMGRMDAHYAMIGMAAVMEGQALYYDAVNEKGLAMAGLNFPGNACCFPETAGKDNVTSFEFIPWVLGQCRSLEEARGLLSRLSLLNVPFSSSVPLAQLHWIIGSREGALVVESTAGGLQVYDNPVGVLTNNPPFPQQLFNLNNYRHLSAGTPAATFGGGLNLDVYCQGLGGLGLPGDLSSMSRFVRAAFHRANSRREAGESGVSQFFHLLASVEMPLGSCRTDGGGWDLTVYSSCMDADLGRYYYVTYDNRRICCVDMHREDLDGRELIIYPIRREQDIFCQN